MPPSYEDEIASAGGNPDVGTAVWFANDRVRVWDLRLEPGQRAPFHAHTRAYFWTCVSPGRAIQRLASSEEQTLDYAEGQTKFTDCSTSDPLIHDLENVGNTVLRFVTVELLD